MGEDVGCPVFMKGSVPDRCCSIRKLLTRIAVLDYCSFSFSPSSSFAFLSSLHLLVEAACTAEKICISLVAHCEPLVGNLIHLAHCNALWILTGKTTATGGTVLLNPSRCLYDLSVSFFFVLLLFVMQQV